MEPSEAVRVRRHEVGSEAATPPSAVVTGVQASALAVPALSLPCWREVRSLVRSLVRSPPSSTTSSALTAGLARPDPHHLAWLDHLLCNELCEV